MTLRPRLAVLITLLSALSLLPAAAASAQGTDPAAPPDPTDTTDQVDPTDPSQPDPDSGLNEVVHSWALSPAGTEEADGVGNRPRISLVADPGAVIEDAVTLFNYSNVPLVFRIYATDAVSKNDDGEFALMEADEVPVDVGTWVDMGADQVPVPAGQKVTIPITITVPENATPGDHTGGILASNTAVSTGPEGQQFNLDRRTGTAIQVRVNGPLFPELAIADVQTDYHPSLNPLGGSATVTYTVENRGNVRLGGTVQASVAGPFGLAEQQGPQTQLVELLPGQRVTYTEEFDDVPAFLLLVTEVEIVPDDGGTSMTSVSRRTNTFAPPVLLLLGLLIALFGTLAWRAYRRHQQRDNDQYPPAGGSEYEDVREPEPLST